MAQFGGAQPSMPAGSNNNDRHVPFPEAGGGSVGVAFAGAQPAPNFGATATTYSRSPPSGTPSSYGRFIQKRGRVGSAGFGGRSSNGGGSSGTSVGRQGTLSGRLRSVSDLEKSGLVTSSEKGRLKDLIISGDESLRSALEKYETGDPSELEGLISRGHLSRSSLGQDSVFDGSDLTTLDNLDLGSLGIDGSDFIGMFEGNPGSVENGKSTSLGRGHFLSRRSDSGGGMSGLLPTPPSGPLSGPMSNHGGNGGASGGRRDSLGSNSNNWDSVNYDFGNLGSSGGLGGSGGGGHGGEPFEMDDLGLPFGGMDDFMSAAGGSGSLGSLGGSGSFRRGSHGGEVGGSGAGNVGGLTSVTAGAANAAAAGMGGSNLATASSMLPPAGRAASSSSAAGASGGGASSGNLPSHATRRAVQLSQQPPSQHDRSNASSGAANKASSSGGGNSGTQRRPAPHHHSAPCAITSAGTVNFPNSTDSGHKFPISNCVAELPSLHTLPPGQAPAYEQLINFQRAKSKESVRCVMCGLAPAEGDAGNVVIPQQNKDVCRDCDKALWVHGDSRVYFKWCKGCKRFRNIVAFSEKLDASKCNGCRERGRRSYLQRKGLPEDDEAPPPEVAGHLDELHGGAPPPHALINGVGYSDPSDALSHHNAFGLDD